MDSDESAWRARFQLTRAGMRVLVICWALRKKPSPGQRPSCLDLRGLLGWGVQGQLEKVRVASLRSQHVRRLKGGGAVKHSFWKEYFI